MDKQQKITWVECPRDAMQGWPHPIATATKVAYLQQLLQVGFDILDCGSFVSPKAIPQMADTKAVLAQLDTTNSTTKLLTIVANLRGAEEAVAFSQISYVGFPLSVSETFQLRNTNKTIAEALEEIKAIQSLCTMHGKELVVYLSMGFGNPYGDPYDTDYILQIVHQLVAMGIRTISLADTVGVAAPTTIAYLFDALIPAFKEVRFGAHFHSTWETAAEKIETALAHGCPYFDSAMKGIGGCPMAKDDLVGNIASEQLLAYLQKNNLPVHINETAFQEALQQAQQLFV
ncbi:MAG: hydroxymethylglutaryl-CoA lyase [Bacteroidota bacterium]